MGLIAMQRSELGQSAIANTIQHIRHSGKITRADELEFRRAAVSDAPLTDDEQWQVRDLMNRLQMGFLQVVD
jgi:hypothetical protein